MEFIFDRPKIFISYSHDSKEHKERVFALANHLRDKGIDCNIDQYELSPPEGWHRWMVNQVEKADYVLVVCTQIYDQRFRGNEETGKGKGVTWEGGIIIQELYDAQGENLKFIPVTFTPDDSEHIPIPLRSVTFYSLDTLDGYELLRRHLTNQHLTPRPELGSIESLPPRERQQFFLDKDSQIALKNVLLNASKGLLNWKRTLGNDQQISRPELELLQNRIETANFSTTIILGAPGSGKSSLMATLGHWAVQEKYALLAIKADYLSNAVNTIEDLQRNIQLDKHLETAIKAIANTEKIILLIDQLDAVSELLDRQPGRLNVLLSMIQSLAENKNVHIVSTCREFEFYHGTQFSRLEFFERLDLRLPSWEKIAPLLDLEKHDSNLIGEPLRELLQNPLHLRIFLEIASPGEVFESYPKLLDKLWRERISSKPEAQQLIVFLTRLAERMTAEEVLWLPSSIADENPETCRTLEQAGILMTNQENSTLGFCHQTFYDHTLARAFARDSKSLADFVLERQDGLFVRPILLRSLNYLRGTAPQQYQRQLKFLLDTAKQRVRSHIRTLLIEFVGSQTNPDVIEVELLIPLLNSDTEGIKVLDAMIGSSGWFRKLQNRNEFTQWLEKPVEQAVYCSALLTASTSFAAEDTWDLLEEYWLDDKSYDFLIIRVIWNIGQWTSERVSRIEQVIQRSNIDWYDVAATAEKIAKVLPNCAANVIRAHLDRLLAQAITESQVPAPELPPDADEVQRQIHAYKYDAREPLKRLIEREGDFYEIEKFAQAYPKSFLDSIWAWFTNIVDLIAKESEPNHISYREDFSIILNRHPGKIVRAILTAILELANHDRQEIMIFTTQNLQSNLLLVHRLLARGLEIIASVEPQFVLNYLLSDQRRLHLGDSIEGRSYETKRLISSICPHLSPSDSERIENAICEFNFFRPWENCEPSTRLELLKYNRQERLQLLLAFPDEYLSAVGRNLRDQEVRAFPWEVAEDRYPTVKGVQSIGPRITKEEMTHASDQDLLNLIDELPDETMWHHPQRGLNRENFHAGGAIQQSREFGKLAKEDPNRILKLLLQLQPQRHELYVGESLVSFSETDFPASQLIQLIEELEKRNFNSEDFRDHAAHALTQVAERNQGLPSSVLALLESWLPTQVNPTLEYYRSKLDRHSELKSPIFFGLGGSHILPDGRGNIVLAIAKGYLKQPLPDMESWKRFIRSQLGVEPHPAVWVNIVANMPPLLNGNRAEATELFDQVIRNCPEVLQYTWTLYSVSRAIGWFEPKEMVQGWLEILHAQNSTLSKQAYGELLLIQYMQYQDEWSVKRIREHLTTQDDNEAILCGLAHAASHSWIHQRCRAISAEILFTLASSLYTSVQHAVATIFRFSREHFRLDKGMLKIIQAVSKNHCVLSEAANDLTEIIEVENLVETHPEIVVEVCKNLLDIITVELRNPERTTVFIAESLTTIAIMLHRQPSYREVGLKIFEQLLALNLRETRSALETLDRKPNRTGLYFTPKRKLRSRQT
jgi:SEFIR domain